MIRNPKSVGFLRQNLSRTENREIEREGYTETVWIVFDSVNLKFKLKKVEPGRLYSFKTVNCDVAIVEEGRVAFSKALNVISIDRSLIIRFRGDPSERPPVSAARLFGVDEIKTPFGWKIFFSFYLPPSSCANETPTKKIKE